MNDNRLEEEDLNDFLLELINLNCLDNPAIGITKVVVDNGYKVLSNKQQFVFKEAIAHHYIDDCRRCGNDIPWSEMSAAEDNGGYCSWCAQVGAKD